MSPFWFVADLTLDPSIVCIINILCINNWVVISVFFVD